MNDVVTAVSTVGFPIVMSILLLYMNQKEGEAHKIEIDELRKTVENNTLALVRLLEKLGGDDH